MFNRMTDYMCKEDSPVQYMCELAIFMIAGFSADNEVDKVRNSFQLALEKSLLLLIFENLVVIFVDFQKHFPLYLHYAPAGCSTKQLLHYGMGATSGKISKISVP